MFHVVLYEPEIPPNTGNIIRLCANTGCDLHLIEPLGFSIHDRALRRAGLDYAESVVLHTYASMDAYLTEASPRRILLFLPTTNNVTVIVASNPVTRWCSALRHVACLSLSVKSHHRAINLPCPCAQPVVA